MNDMDWRGEHLIRGRRLTDKEAKEMAVRVGTAQHKAEREKRGHEHPAAAAHRRWFRAVIEGGRK